MVALRWAVAEGSDGSSVLPLAVTSLSRTLLLVREHRMISCRQPRPSHRRCASHPRFLCLLEGHIQRGEDILRSRLPLSIHSEAFAVRGGHRGLHPLPNIGRSSHRASPMRFGVRVLSSLPEHSQQRLRLLDAIFILATAFHQGTSDSVVLREDRLIVCEGALQSVVHHVALIKRAAQGGCPLVAVGQMNLR